MNFCQHKQKVNLFCLAENCQENSCGGCAQCMKVHHSHQDSTLFINESDLEKIVKKYQFAKANKPNYTEIADDCYAFFINFKTEFNRVLDEFAKSIFHKIKYCHLYQNGILEGYIKIKTKDYYKLTSKELKLLYEKVKNKPERNSENHQEELSYALAIQKIQNIFQNMPNQIERISSIFNLPFHQKLSESLAKSIKSLRKGCQAIKIQKQIKIKENQIINKEKERLKPVLPEMEIQKIFPKRFLTPNLYNNVVQPPVNIQKFNFKNLEYVEKKNDQTFRINENQQIIKKLEQKKNDKQSKEANEIEIETNKKFSSVNLRKQENQLSNQMNPSSSRNEQLNKSVKNIEQNSRIQVHVLKSRESERKDLNLNSKEKFNQSKKQLANIIREREEHLKKNYESMKSKEIVVVEATTQSKENQKKNDQSLHSRRFSAEMKGEQIRSYKQVNKNQSSAFYLPSKNRTNLITQTLSLQKHQDLNDSLSKHFQFKIKEKDDHSKQFNSDIKKQIPFPEEQLKPQVIHAPLKKQKIQNIHEYDHKRQQKQIIEADALLSKINDIFSKKDCEKISALEEILKSDENNISVADLLGFLYFKDNRLKQCLALTNNYLNKLENTKERSLHGLNLMINRSAALNASARYSQCILFAEECLLTCKNDKLYKNLGDAYFSVGIFEKAVYNYEKAVKMNQKLDEAFYNMGVCHFLQQSFYIAKIQMEKALLLSPKNHVYLQLFKEIQSKIQRNAFL